ncbi:MAG TPA: glycosyltransferase [Bacteroidales bacterium]|nr:glycosyltransferase [Bacteroidales bacterium]
MTVAIIDGIAAHYRLSLFQKLSIQQEIEYHLFASKETFLGIKTIDPYLASAEISDGGIRWTFIDNIVIFNRIIWQNNVLNITSKGNFDVYLFIGESNVISTWIGVIICKLRRKKIAFWGHGTYGNEKFVKKLIRQMFNKLPDSYLLYNERAKYLLKEEGIKEESLFVVYNSLNYDVHVNIRNYLEKNEISSLKRRLFPLNFDLPVLVFIGRLTPEKKIEQLVESVELLHRKGKKVNCIIIGSGDMEDILRKLVSSLDLEEYFSFYGACYEEKENALLLSMADCCISPGNVGLTAIHSLSFGTPVITHNDLPNQMPEVSSIIEGLTGELFDRNCVNDLAEKIEKLVFIKGKNHYSDHCIKLIDNYYNPYYQVKVFNMMVDYLTVKVS